MHDREEWVLVTLGSQHKPKERPVRPVFPDYPFLMTMMQHNLYAKIISGNFVDHWQLKHLKVM